MAKSLLYSLQSSHCCASRSLIVVSREGGFITQNCTSCGKPRAIRPEHIPSALCTLCSIPMLVKVFNKNYAYICQRCTNIHMIYQLVPAWEEYFEYTGFAIPNLDNYSF
ncbi:hypothetical protein [Herpetosiphon giganteus]|uniref:hypothetical protein n=1 Tax=Herpetosiphon giganteus TaxID=2029754 RepID=UPI00195D9473|nr:hypothetical protein [Herpetosiphon giganteus]MBM7846193.1 endogenous inhibitor of DNA gyrase (YacG/DUF329 family) [Herpetosiphon giganteus]